MDLAKIRSWIEKGKKTVRSLLPRRERYRPERHYMRGPGPRARKKQNWQGRQRLRRLDIAGKIRGTTLNRGVKNILFIMCDQLRFDYLSCAGHPALKTPNIDALAAKGVRFTRAYVQSPVCGASRMSFYTGRYVQSHGAAWNGFPLKVGEMTMGDYLRALGVRTVLIGKTHMQPDTEGMERLGIDPRIDHRRTRIGMRLRSLRARRRTACHRSRRPLRSAHSPL